MINVDTYNILLIMHQILVYHSTSLKSMDLGVKKNQWFL